MSNCRSCRFARGGFDCLVISGDDFDAARMVDRWADSVEWVKTGDATYPVDGASLCPGYASVNPVTPIIKGESMTQEQLDKWFTYHAPTDETAPKYAAIRASEQNVILDVTQTSYEGVSVVVLHGRINVACKHFAMVIDAQAPDSADKTAAIRCVRLARNLFNEWAAESSKPTSERAWSDPRTLFVAAELELCKARMQANSAIACGGK